MNDIFEVNNNFYNKYNTQIRIIVTRILNSANQVNDIDDCVNTVYLELMEKLQQYNEVRGSMAAFVAVIARSTALSYCRSNMRKPGELIGSEKIDFITEPFEFEDTIEFKMLVENILKKLKQKERDLFTMRYILYYSSEETAKLLKITRNAADVRVNRLKRKIKSFLIKGGVNL
ncbi:MAG: sigma-70 family RNA polymerase sigma factor [Oscillospiraceae bacterium]|nr:sigma-70 family RNA polymerase sigma factor [Oscillospiraceae bacterium]